MSENAEVNSSGRARRRTAKRVDYAKEQDFSDEDIFEEEQEKEEPTRPTPRRARTPARAKQQVPSDDDANLDDYQAPRPVFTEKGYDPNQLPLRERFPFLPETEADGSPRIELIVGRRPIDQGMGGDVGEGVATPAAEETKATGKRGRRGKKGAGQSPAKKKEAASDMMEYEYLIKYKGVSYLHLEWKTGAELEGMSKTAKTMYRRWLKKLAAGTEEDLEDPEFDQSYIAPQKVVDEADHEVTVELSDKELLEWEKEQKKNESEDEDEEEVRPKSKADENKDEDENQEKKEPVEDLDFGDGEIDFLGTPIQRLRDIVKRESNYYPVHKGSDNPYRDGYATEPPKKPRASYLFFQAVMRPHFHKRNPDATQAELMSLLGEAWRNMPDEQQAPFLQLASEEAEQYEKEKALLAKAQKPNEVWQPMRRCLMVLDHISQDSFADIFLEPVDTNDFPDYEDIVDQPMDLGTVREKLLKKKYQAPENFARDVRKVWNNCKVYNQHGTQIWYVADYMSKHFERLFHAWVLQFRDRYLRWAHPKARPWELTCRQDDGKCGVPNEKLLICDHCDAGYSLECLKMSKPPEGEWHCSECKPKLKKIKEIRLLSATAEHSARKKAELGDIPKKKVKIIKFLVKWAGLGYEFCTWETKEDINDDKMIEDFHRLNNMTPDEPELPQDTADKVVRKMEHISVENAGGSTCIPDLRSQLYAQTRAFHFTKFGSEVPEKLARHCGPRTYASEYKPLGKVAPDETKEGLARCEPYLTGVVECLNDIVHRVVRSNSQPLVGVHPALPPPLTGEYDAILPITSKGLMMNVGELQGSVAFLGYRNFPDGSKGPAEIGRVIRSVGDKIVAVDGIPTADKSFKEVIGLLKKSGKNKYAFMRFLENRYAAVGNDFASVGTTGRFATETLRSKFSLERQRLLVERKLQDPEEEDQEETPENEDDESVRSQQSSNASEDEGSEGEFEPDSEDEAMAQAEEGPYVQEEDKEQQVDAQENPNAEEKKEDSQPEAASSAEEKFDPSTFVKQETTKSLAFRLLDVDLDYSSDEGGEEDCAYFLDGVDCTFSTDKDNQPKEEPEEEKKAGSKKKKKKEEDDEPEATYPIKGNEFEMMGDRGKLAAAVALTKVEPVCEDFENFPRPSNKELEAIKAAEEAVATRRQSQLDGLNPDSPSKQKRSTVKVEQVHPTTGEVVRVWANAETAAGTLQISLDEIRNMLRLGEAETYGDEVGGFRWRFALAGAEVTKLEKGATKGSKKGRDALYEFRDKLYDHEDPHVYKNGNKLRDYQVDGVNWLASTWYKQHGCILADEMGLGKTVQIVTYIEHLYRAENIKRPFLVVVPLSTVEHWRREFQAWTDMMCCVYHDRQRIWRDVLREYEWYFEDRPHTFEYLKFDVLVTTYDTLIADFDVVGQVPWRVAVVDEAHRLRNQKGKLLECMKEISARGTLHYGFQSRVLMTGTPLQNNTQELWTLLNFIEPYQFPSLDDFQMRFGNMANREQVEALQRMISPFMLRRVKEDVAKDIPAKEETVIDVELTSIQKQYYRAIFEQNHTFLSMGVTRTNAPKLMNIQMELRKCCNHPYLLDNVEHRESQRLFNEYLERGKFDGKSPEEQQFMLNESGYIMTSGKMVLLDKLLPKLREEGHKVLLFSQMVKMLDLISEYCEFRGFRYERLDGRVRGNERQKSIDRFETEPDSFMFLLSTRAGGVGINLTAADICIIFDSDWNPQNDVQAQARCHRIGQTKDVRIYRLVTSRSFEQEMFDRASKKLGLEQAVLGTFNQDSEEDKPTTKEMENLLKKGAYALLEDENDEVTNEFCSDDIESILAKRTRTRVVEGAKSAGWLNKQGMIVSKSKFSADGDNVDVDDPNFWQKVMPDFVTPAIMLGKLDELTELIEGTAPKKGRGRGRRKLSPVPEATADDKKADEERGGNGENRDGPKKDQVNDKPTEKDGDRLDEGSPANETSTNDVDGVNDDENKEDNDEKEKKLELSRAQQRKVNKFMTDLKSMMDGVLEEVEDDSLPNSEKAECQKLLLTISVKERIFSEEQRHLARVLLKRLEGDRRRRCRTSTEGGSRLSSGRTSLDVPDTPNAIPEDLLILSKQQRRKRRKKAEEGKKKAALEVGDDGYLLHSDSEGDWSDVGGDIYDGKKKRSSISEKEAKRRRAWAAGLDAASAAGKPWPTFPRTHLVNVLKTVIDECIEYDTAKGGMFSEPVPRDQYPEYYEQIKNPMDYGTIKAKLEAGEYRSAQAMQKDFVLVMQNCLKFNDARSDVVKEARQQALMRPKLLKTAAAKHNLFLAEDGTVLEILDEKAKKAEGEGKKKRKRKKKDGEEGEEGEAGEAGEGEPKKKKKRKKKVDGEEGEAPRGERKEGEGSEKPRIKINGKKKKRAEEAAEGEQETPIPKKKRKKSENGDEGGTSKKKKKKSEGSEGSKDAKPEPRVVVTDPPGCFLESDLWKKERTALDKSFETVRDFVTSRGPWQLVPELEDRFSDVARLTLLKIVRHDRYDVFTDAVTEDEAPGYYEVVKKPMDFSKMKEKVEAGSYGTGSDAAAKLYEDFLLVFDNCVLYNDEDGEVVEEAARLFALVPETFVVACTAVAGKRKKTER